MTGTRTPEQIAYTRQYSEAELAAARRLGFADKKEPGRGLIYGAGGDWWPKEMERKARAARRDADRAELVAAALRREQAKDGTL